MAGPASTLRYIPAREDLDVLSVFENRKYPQRDAVERIAPGHVMVIDSRGNARAASAGSILIHRIQMRGAAGVVSDGGFRDCAAIIDLGFPTFCQRPSAPTNLIHHHAVDIDVPIACGEVPVYPGDWVVGDTDGVVVMPKHLVAEIAEEAVTMTAFEDYVDEEVGKGRSIVGLYPPNAATRKEYETARKR
jgi:regulator of RNase E activity RraA